MRFQKRKPRQRVQDLLPMLLFQRGRNAVSLWDPQDALHVGTVQVLGEFWGWSPEGFGSTAERTRYQRLAVTLDNGTVVPAYRRKGSRGHYAICQDCTRLPRVA